MSRPEMMKWVAAVFLAVSFMWLHAFAGPGMGAVRP